MIKLLMKLILISSIWSTESLSNNCFPERDSIVRINNMNLGEIKTENVTLHINRFSLRPYVTLYKCSRRKYAILTLKAAGEIVEYKFDGPHKLLPDEARQWAKTGLCNIGKICQPDGDCWGEDAQICRSDSTDDIVRPRVMKYNGLTWTKSLFRTCVMDWSCDVKPFKLPVFVDGSGNLYVNIDQKMIPAVPDSHYETPSEVYIFGKDEIIIRNDTLQVECFGIDKATLCMSNKLDNGVISFTADKPCSYQKDKFYCINMDGYKQIRADSIKSKEAMYLNQFGLDQMTSKLVEIEMALIYNAQMNKLLIAQIHNRLIQIIKSSSRYNPYILKDLNLFSSEIINLNNEMVPLDCGVKADEKTGVESYTSVVNLSLYSESESIHVPILTDDITLDGMKIFKNNLDEFKHQTYINYKKKNLTEEPVPLIVPFNMKDWILTNVFNCLTIVNTILLILRR
uniref:Hemagglutinin n=1 Tax=Hubei orthomyxo-like virus 2 TaxID=1923006 RepID=A0A1L3KKI8_9VIRU|nr:hemagglutinin [Hubei orthomyxo-like virus 2]